MSYSPPGGGGSQIVEELFYKQSAVEVLPTGQQQSNAKEFAKWQLIPGPGALDITPYALDIVITAEIRRTAGGGFPQFVLESSVDGISWVFQRIISGTGASFSPEIAVDSTFQFDSANKFFRFSAWNSNGSTSGEIQNFQGYMSMVIGENWTLVKLI